MHYIVTTNEGTLLPLAGIPEQWIRACSVGVTLIWDRAGHRRQVPQEVLITAVDVCDAASLLVEKGVLDGLPASVGFIRWDETTALSEMDFRLDVLPRGGEPNPN